MYHQIHHQFHFLSLLQKEVQWSIANDLNPESFKWIKEKEKINKGLNATLRSTWMAETSSKPWSKKT